jgi:hypothetical protein
MTAGVTVPCGVSISGPVVSPSVISSDGYLHLMWAPTAIISSTATQAFIFGSCSTAASFKYMEVNGNRPSSYGGQAIYVTSAGGVSNLTISYNYFHGNNWNGTSGAPYGSGAQNAVLVLFDGSGSAANDANDTVSWNRFGANGDCAGVMTSYTYSGYGGDGGYCTGIGTHTTMSNMTFENNFIYFQEEGIKGYEGSWLCTNCIISYNDVSNWHRIAIEVQVGSPTTPGTTFYYQYNSVHDPYYVGEGTFGISAASGCNNDNPSGNTCTAHVDGNVLVENYPVNSSNPYNGIGIEFWSADSASTANYNIVQGVFSTELMISEDGSMTGNGNLLQSPYGHGGNNTPSLCGPQYGTSNSYGWNAMEDGPVNTPTGTGNVCQFINGSVQTSATPSVSPAGGAVSVGTVVTIGTTGTNRDTNTTQWCTTDSSTPVPGTGTATIMTSYTVTSNVTLKCVGMWGAANQPTTYATGPLSGTYGYQPSGVVTNSYTVGGSIAPPPGLGVTVISENRGPQ